jgi:hypothetical protein
MTTKPLPSTLIFEESSRLPGDLWLKLIKRRGKVMLSHQTYEEINKENLNEFCEQNLLEIVSATGGYMIKPYLKIIG